MQTEIQKQQMSALPALRVELSSFTMNCSQSTGLSKSLVEAAIKGWGFPIRKMDSISADLQTLNLITEVALNYGSRVQAPPMVYKECLEVMQQKFSHLGVDEIREAYRANAAGELETKGKGEMYGGEFNAANFTAVMAAYSEKRRKVIAEYTNALHEAQQAEIEAQIKEKLAAQFEIELPGKLNELAEKAEDWQGCPEYLYHSCEKRGMIDLTPAEKREIFARAFDIAKVQMQLKKSGAVSIAEIRECKNETSEDRARVIARQIALWECVVMPMKMELI